MVAHDAERLPGHDHVADNVQRLANARAAVDDVAQKQGNTLRVAPDAGHNAITKGVEQVLKGLGTKNERGSRGLPF